MQQRPLLLISLVLFMCNMKSLVAAFAVIETTPLLLSASRRISGDVVSAAKSSDEEITVASSRPPSPHFGGDHEDEGSEESQTPNSRELITEAALSPIQTFKAYSLNMDVPLFLYFVFFYIGNYGYSITNKLALKASGSPHGYPLTISALQLGIGCLYAIFLWLAPDARSHPQITPQDLLKMIPVAFCTAGSHSASVFGYAHGSVSFVSIVKAAEPVFAAILSQFVYQRPVSLSKWLCLPIIISGVVLASVSEVNFSWTALASACVANLIAAFRGNETKKLLQTEGLKDRIGGAGNQFALTAILGFLMWAPLALLKEGDGLPHFVGLLKNTTENDLRKWLVVSAFFYYGYNELRTVTLKKTSAVTGSVANTLKRVIVIVGVALALGEPLGPLKILGSMVAVGGVFLYSIVE